MSHQCRPNYVVIAGTVGLFSFLREVNIKNVILEQYFQEDLFIILVWKFRDKILFDTDIDILYLSFNTT